MSSNKKEPKAASKKPKSKTWETLAWLIGRYRDPTPIEVTELSLKLHIQEKLMKKVTKDFNEEQAQIWARLKRNAVTPEMKSSLDNEINKMDSVTRSTLKL
jgi:hypothetical protein